MARGDFGDRVLEAALERELTVEIEAALEARRSDDVALQDGGVADFCVGSGGGELFAFGSIRRLPSLRETHPHWCPDKT